MGAASTSLVSRPMAGFRCVESGRVDAGHRRNVVDDHADTVSVAHCPYAKRGQSYSPFTRFTRRVSADIFDRRRLLIFWQSWTRAAAVAQDTYFRNRCFLPPSIPDQYSSFASGGRFGNRGCCFLWGGCRCGNSFLFIDVLVCNSNPIRHSE